MVINQQIEPDISQLSQIIVKPSELTVFSVRKKVELNLSCVVCHLSRVTCHVLGVPWHMPNVTCHMSQTLTATARDPSLANSPTTHSGLVYQDRSIISKRRKDNTVFKSQCLSVCLFVCLYLFLRVFLNVLFLPFTKLKSLID